MQYIVPILSDGMLELSNTLPEDPIEFMVSYTYLYILIIISRNIYSEEALKLEKDHLIIKFDKITYYFR